MRLTRVEKQLKIFERKTFLFSQKVISTLKVKIVFSLDVYEKEFIDSEEKPFGKFLSGYFLFVAETNPYRYCISLYERKENLHPNKKENYFSQM